MDKQFLPDHYERSAAIWEVVMEGVDPDPRKWTPQADVIEHAVLSGCHPGTVANLISSAIKFGRLEKRGRWSMRSDTRELRRVDL